MSRKLNHLNMIAGASRFFRYAVWGGLLNVNLEVTKRCNARCDFCRYWREEPTEELADYVPAVRRLNPLSVSLTGGEPLMRSDLPRIISGLRRNFGFLFISLVTNGALLGQHNGLELWNSGLDELSISLDYLDERHDRARGIPGLSRHILETAPVLKGAGVNLCFNVMLEPGDPGEPLRIIRHAAGNKVKVSVTTYNPVKAGGKRDVSGPELEAVRESVEEILKLKAQCGNVTSSPYYLRRIPEFFAKGGVEGCTAGLNWVQLTPDGMVKRCADRNRATPCDAWRPETFGRTDCTLCWYSCRGAAQEPITPRRFAGMVRETLFG